MSIGFLFWLLMIIWFVFGLYRGRTSLVAGDIAPLGGDLLLFILLSLLGVGIFGWPLHG